jgi:hypothetical protein
MRALLVLPIWLYLVTPLDIMSFTTKFRKIDTRTSKGMAKGILLSTPSRGDMTANWRLKRVSREDWDSDLDICTCRSSRLKRDRVTCLTFIKKIRGYIHRGFYERLHIELGRNEPLVWRYKWFSGTKVEYFMLNFNYKMDMRDKENKKRTYSLAWMSNRHFVTLSLTPSQVHLT